MNQETKRHERRQKGTSTVELAFLLPLLLLIALGVADFARVFYMSVEVANAARAGVQYGAQSLVASTDYAGMINAAKNDAAQIPSLTATATHWCQCPGSGSPVSCSSSTCTGYGAPDAYVQVSTQATFHTLVNYPGIPSTLTLSKQAIMRAP